jgi:allantoate deiminase
MDAAQRIVTRLEELARCTDDPPRLTRLSYSRAMTRAHALVGDWMLEAGLEVRTDAIGNLVGRLPCRRRCEQRNRTLLMGSHLDSVRDAGRFDGPLGVLLALACAEERTTLPFALEVIGFMDEEGVRFHSTYLGSRALAGALDDHDLALRDSDGITLADAIASFGCDPAAIGTARREDLLGYIEAHIEQGPVLEALGLPLGVVSAIAGQTRVRTGFVGKAGHAGTVPMNLRHDALCCAAEFVLAVEAAARETKGLVATVGELGLEPGASNVIPGRTQLTLDVRHASDAVRRAAVDNLQNLAQSIASQRGINAEWHIAQSNDAVQCDRALGDLLGPGMPSLASGAGHDAIALAALCPVAMLFVRCREGLSHHPDEFVSPEDIALALDAMLNFLDRLAASHG